MIDQKDFYRCAQLLIHQYAEQAEQVALEKMQVFMDKHDMQAAGTWLIIAQTIQQLHIVPSKQTLH